MKSFYASRQRTKRSLSLFFVICLFLLGISIQAQDLPTTEPVPTEATTQPAPEVLPSEPPAITPTAEVVVTEDATAAPVTVIPEVMADPTQDATLEPLPVTPTPELTAESTEPSSPVTSTPAATLFPLLYKAAFEGSDAAGLSRHEGWSQVAVEGGTALQASSSAVPVTYTAATLNEGAVEARFWIVDGEGQISLGAYSAVLAADGTATLTRERLAIASTVVTLTPNTWALVRLEISGAQIRLFVNNTLAVDFTETSPLPGGQASFAASPDALLRVDDFAVYGTPNSTPVLERPVLVPNAAIISETLQPPVLTNIGSVATGRPDFTWTSVTDAVSYVVEVNDVCGDGSPIVSKNVTALFYKMAAAELPLVQGEYVACVKSIDQAGDESVFSQPTTFLMLHNTEPAHGNWVTSTMSMPMKWNHAKGINSQVVTYVLQIDTEAAFTLPLTHESLVITGGSATTLTYTLPTALPAGSYYWRIVRYVDGVADPINTTRAFVFFVGTRGAAPVLQSPALNAVVNGPVTLKWGAVTAPTGTNLTGYRVRLNSSLNPNEPIVAFVPVTSAREYVFVPPAGLNNINYGWYVQGMQDDVPITFQPARTLYVDNVAPDAPTITSTSNQVAPGSPLNLAWNAVDGTTNYTVSVLDSVTSQDVVAPQNTTNTFFTFWAHVPEGSYILRVRANDAVNSSPWSTLPINVVPRPLAPTNLVVTSGEGSVTLTWTDTNSNESGYQIQAMVGSGTVDINVPADSTSYTHSNLVCGMTYIYSMRAYRDDIATSQPSQVVIARTNPCAPVPCPALNQIHRVTVGTNSQIQTAGFGLFAIPEGTLSETGRYAIFQSDIALTGDYQEEFAVEGSQLDRDYYSYDSLTCTTAKLPEVDGYLRLYKVENKKAIYETAEGYVLYDWMNDTLTTLPIPEPIPGPIPTPIDIDMTDDGRYVIFYSKQHVGGITIPDTNGSDDAYAYDTVTNSFQALSVGPNNTMVGLGPKMGLLVADSKLYVVFEARDNVYGGQLLIRNVTDGVSAVVSLNDDESMLTPGSGFAGMRSHPVIVHTGDEIKVLFEHWSGGQVPIITTYLRTVSPSNLAVGTTQLLPFQISNMAALSNNGRWLIFDTYEPLMADDTNNVNDVYVHDLVTNTTRRVNAAVAAPDYNGDELLAVKPDGSSILISTLNASLVANDTNAVCEIDRVDEGPNESGMQLDYNENCPDLFLIPNPLFVAPDPVTPTPEPTLEPTPQPTLDAPVVLAAQFLETGRPKFNWTPVVGATSYTIEVNDVCGDGTFDYRVTTASNGTYQMPDNVARLPQGLYSYCIKASNVSGGQSPYSGQTPLKIAYNYAPADGALSSGSGITLNYWSFGDSTITYRFTVDTDAAFALPHTYQNTVGYYNGMGAHSLPSLPIGVYYWRVERLINGTPEPVHSPTSFKLLIGGLWHHPGLISPADNATVNTPVSLTWGSAGSGLPITHYRVEIATSSAFTTIVAKADIAAEAPLQYIFAPSSVTDGTEYFWHVVGMNGDTEVTSTTPTLRLVVDNSAIQPPAITAPGISSILNVPRPTFTWAFHPVATQYDVAVQNATTQTDVIAEQSTTALAFTPAVDLPSGSYVLRVRASNGSMNSAWATRTFTINLPLQPPTNLVAVSGDGSVTLTWTDTNDNETGYEVQPFHYPFHQFPTIKTQNSASFTHSNLVCGMTYGYMVRAYRASDGKTSDWSVRVVGRSNPCAPVPCPLLNHTHRVNVGTNSQLQMPGVDSLYSAMLSETGRYAVFSSFLPLTGDYQAEFAAEGNSFLTDYYMYDPVTCVTTKVPDPVGVVSLIKAENSKAIIPSGMANWVLHDWAQNTNQTLPLPMFNTIDMTDDGRYVIFSTLVNFAGSNVPDTNNIDDIYVYDTVANTFQGVSVGLDNTMGSADMMISILMANNKLYVLFASAASNLVAGDTNNTSDVFIRNVTDGVTTMISVWDDESLYSSISSVAAMQRFTHMAVVGSDLKVLFLNGSTLYTRTVNLSNLSVGATQPIFTFDPALDMKTSVLSANGRWIAFATVMPLVIGDTDNLADVYVYDTVLNTTERVQSASIMGNVLLGMSPDGQNILLSSSNALVSNDNNAICEVDNVDEDPAQPGWQLDSNENCYDAFRVPNPLYVATTPVTPTPEPTLEPTLEPTVEPTEEPTPEMMLVIPADGAVLIPAGAATTVNVAFSWSYAGSADEYTVQVDDEATFTAPLFTCDSATTGCSIPAIGYGSYVWRVLVDGVTNPVIASFAVSPAAPRAVTLTSPANGRYLLPNERPEVVLAWNWGASPAPAGGEFSYNIEIATDNTFATPLFSPVVTAQTFTTESLDDGTYFWRVQAVNAYGVTGAWSAPFSFIVDSLAPTTAPSVTVPAANAIVSSSRPNIQWSAATGAYRYVVEVNDVCGVGEPYYQSSTLITTTSHTIPGSATALPQGTHVVCVTAYDRSDNKITSASHPFSVFIGTGPGNGTFVALTVRPIFTWIAAGETGKTITYQVQIDPTGSDFTSGDIETSPAVTAATLTWANPLPAGTYAWRVLRLINGTAQPFTDGLFRTLYSGAQTTGPDLLSPAHNTLINIATILTWDEATSPVNVTLTDYEVQVSRNTAYTQIVSSEIVPASDTLEHVFTPAANQNVVTHYWRVRGLSDGMPVTGWTQRTVRVDDVPPASPNVTAPVAESLLNTTRPSFKWTAVTGATQYKIDVVYAGTTTPAMDSKTQATLTLVPATNLPQADLTLHVSAYDGLNWGTPTAINFKVRLGTAPTQNAVVTTDRPAFSWTGVLGATGYILQIDNDADFSSPLITQTTTGAGYTLTAAQKLTPNVYYWRVDPILPDPDGVGYPAGDASRSFAYGVALAPASPMTSLSDSGTTSLLATSSPRSIFNRQHMESAGVTFSWRDVTPAPLSYQIQISTSSLFPRVGTVQQTVLSSPVSLTLPAVTDGLKYWRVRAVYSADGMSFGPWSLVNKFTLDRAVPSLPMTLSATTSSSARPVFTWSKSIGAAKYHLKVIDVASGATVIEKAVTTTSYALPTTLEALKQNNVQGYAWTVQAEDTAGNRSAASLPRTLTLFSGVSPSVGQVVADTTPIFKWTAVTGKGAASWTLQIASNAAMTENLYTSPALSAAAASFTLPTASARTPGLHYWRVVRAGDNAAQVQPQPFTIVSSSVGTAATLTAPITGKTLNKADITSGVSLTWAAPTNAGLTGLITSYKVEIAKANTFTAASLVKTETVSGTTMPLPTLTDGLYYWRVRPVLAPNGTLGPVSAIYSLKIDQTAPGRPLLLLPVTHAVVTTTRTPTFTWKAATGTPTQYVIEIAENATFDSPLYSAVVAAALVPSHKLPPAEALPNGGYYWRVLAKDAAGNLSSGAVRRLTVAAP